jgi:hypothetical protein
MHSFMNCAVAVEMTEFAQTAPAMPTARMAIPAIKRGIFKPDHLASACT